MATLACHNCNRQLEADRGQALAVHGQLFTVCDTCAVAGQVYTVLSEVVLTPEARAQTREHLTQLLEGLRAELAAQQSSVVVVARPARATHIFDAYSDEEEYLNSLRGQQVAVEEVSTSSISSEDC